MIILSIYLAFRFVFLRDVCRLEVRDLAKVLLLMGFLVSHLIEVFLAVWELLAAARIWLACGPGPSPLTSRAFIAGDFRLQIFFLVLSKAHALLRSFFLFPFFSLVIEEFEMLAFIKPLNLFPCYQLSPIQVISRTG
jgi:hypothetical protein